MHELWLIVVHRGAFIGCYFFKLLLQIKHKENVHETAKLYKDQSRQCKCKVVERTSATLEKQSRDDP